MHFGIRMKQRYFIQISYKGTDYHGWQVQPNAITVQSIIDKSLSTVIREQIETTGAGRTDTGVHAKFFIAHFDSLNQHLNEDSNIIYSLNGILPKDISIHRIYKVAPDTHARFSAISRTYEYHISRIKNPFENEYSWYVYGPLNIKVMNEASELLKKFNDYTSFSKTHTDVKTNLCKICYSKWEEHGDKLIFSIQADRFLRNMVRAIVGTMIDIGLEKIQIPDLINIFKIKKRKNASRSAPACGLFLTKIEYPVNIN